MPEIDTSGSMSGEGKRDRHNRQPRPSSTLPANLSPPSLRRHHGVLAELTVYAVPQVLSATLPIGALSNQVGTVVKLVRVRMLGPIVLGLSLLTRRLRDETDEGAPRAMADLRVNLDAW